MNYSRLKIWFIVTITIVIISIVIRAIWQIVVIPTPGTMLIFIPIIVSILGMNILFAYLIVNPRKFKSLPVLIGVTIALTAGLLGGVVHYFRFIISPEAEPVLSKIISTFLALSCISAYLLILRLIWYFGRNKDRLWTGKDSSSS